MTGIALALVASYVAMLTYIAIHMIALVIQGRRERKHEGR